MKTLLSPGTLLLSLALSTLPCHAGVLLTKTKQTQTGALTDAGATITLQSSFGNIAYKKEDLLWFSLDRDIDTLFKAAQKARGEGNAPAALELFTQSAAKEPVTQTQAQQELQTIRAQALEKTATTAEAATGGDPYINYSPEQKITRGKQMIENGNTQLKQLESKPKPSDNGGRGNYVPIGGQIPGTIGMGQSSPGTVHMNGGMADTPKGASEDEKLAKAANNLIHDGEELVKRGEEDLAQLKERQAEEEKKKAEIQKAIDEARHSQDAMFSLQAWTQEEKLANLGVAALFIFIAMALLWRTTMREA